MSNSLISILNPLIATALYAFVGLNGVIAVDIGSFAVAFVALLFFIRIPESKLEKRESVLNLAKEGLVFLRENPMIMTLILFMSGVNLVASAFDATLPGYVILRTTIPVELQGRVYACRNTLQFFTIPIGLFLGGFMVDYVCELFFE